MKKVATLLLCLTAIFVSCSKKNIQKTDNHSSRIIVGFSQIGAESAWRTCHTESVKAAAAAAGIQLVYENAEQKQENQIKAIRSFIAYQVDVIVFVPIVTDGWDSILHEAKDAEIPVLVIDRKISIKDDSLYAGFIGTDSYTEGRKCAEFLQKKYKTAAVRSRPLTIFELTGTVDSSPAIWRSKGFRETLEHDPSFKIIGSGTGDFLRSLGKEVFATALDTYPEIDIVFSHNDGMTLGVLDECAERNIDASKKFCIVSVDGEQAAIDAIRDGKINCIAECNPFQGPEVMVLAKQLAEGHSIPKTTYVKETVFDETMDLSSLQNRGY